MAGAWRLGWLLVPLLATLGAPLPGTVVRLNKAALNYVSDISKAPLQRALKVTVPDFLDQNGEVLQSSRFQVLDVRVPHLHLKFIAGFGVRLLATANFTVRVFGVREALELGLPVVLLADVHVAQDSIGTLVLGIATCSARFRLASVLNGSNRTSPVQLALAQKHIKAVLNNKLCLLISGLVQDLNVHLGTLIGLTPVGPESQIRYSMTTAPTITGDYMSLDVSAVLYLLGVPIHLPFHDASPFMLPWAVGNRSAMVNVGLSQHVFESVLLLLQKAGSLNLDITGQLNSEDNTLNTSVMGRLIPEVARQFPEPMPVVLKVQLGTTPTVTLRANNATLRLQPFVEVLVASSNSAFQTLFSLDVVVNLSLQLSVSEAKLRGTTSVLGGVQVSVASSNVGSIDMDQMHTLTGNVFQKALLDHLNALLGMGIALPSVLNLHYAHPEVLVCEGYVVISSGLSYQR
uniref:BPI fold containing family B, member 2 n=1 Tax=Jaculus jaculus TaxID=51337 RepID=A0A8C5KY04_JACJA